MNQTVIYSWSTNHADRLIMFLRAKRQFGHGWDFCPSDLLDGKLWFYFAWFLFDFCFFFIKADMAAGIWRWNPLFIGRSVPDESALPINVSH